MSQINYSLNSYERPKLKTPNGEKKLLLHSCCAPCAGEIMEALAASDIDTTIFFYNPNIHPVEEYELRKEENVRFAQKLGMPIIDAIMIVMIGLRGQKGKRMSLKEGRDVQHVLICALKEPLGMLLKITLTLFHLH